LRLFTSTGGLTGSFEILTVFTLGTNTELFDHPVIPLVANSIHPSFSANTVTEFPRTRYPRNFPLALGVVNIAVLAVLRIIAGVICTGRITGAGETISGARDVVTGMLEGVRMIGLRTGI
jgi:hypothetical protein